MPQRLPLPSKLTFSSTTFKWLALILMTLDHAAVVFYPFNGYTLIRSFGRLAFPLFAYFVGEGCIHTRHPLRYFLRLLLPGLLFQGAYAVATYVMYGIADFYGNVFLTFAMGVGNAILYRQACRDKRRRALWILLLFAALAAEFALSYLFTGRMLLFGVDCTLPLYHLRVQYGFVGILMPLSACLFRHPMANLASFTLCTAAMSAAEILIFGDPVWQWWCMLAPLLLLLYNGKRGRYPMKYFFYIYYPAHLVALEGLSMLLM